MQGIIARQSPVNVLFHFFQQVYDAVAKLRRHKIYVPIYENGITIWEDRVRFSGPCLQLAHPFMSEEEAEIDKVYDEHVWPHLEEMFSRLQDAKLRVQRTLISVFGRDGLEDLIDAWKANRSQMKPTLYVPTPTSVPIQTPVDNLNYEWSWRQWLDEQ
jgi:hypothetical protein